MDSFTLAREVLRMSLQLGARADQLEPGTPLMGNFPEFNSLTVMGIVSSIEEQIGVTISD